MLERSLWDRITRRATHGGSISHAQCGEDLIIRFVTNMLGVPFPSYVDAGAHNPFRFSNTAHFYRNGSRGINIEANPLLHAEFLKHRPRDVNLNVGVHDTAGQMDFFVIDPPTMSTFDKAAATACVEEHGFSLVETRSVRVDRLHDLVDRHWTGKLPEILSVDVEGIDEAVIGSIDFTRWRPLVICSETIEYATTGMGRKRMEVPELLKQHDYFPFADTYINTIMVCARAWSNRSAS